MNSCQQQLGIQMWLCALVSYWMKQSYDENDLNATETYHSFPNPYYNPWQSHCEVCGCIKASASSFSTSFVTFYTNEKQYIFPHLLLPLHPARPSSLITTTFTNIHVQSCSFIGLTVLLDVFFSIRTVQRE